MPADTHTPAYCRHPACMSSHVYRGSWCTDLEKMKTTAVRLELYSRGVVQQSNYNSNQFNTTLSI